MPFKRSSRVYDVKRLRRVDGQPACFGRHVSGTNTKTSRAALARISPVKNGLVRVDAKLGEGHENRSQRGIFFIYIFFVHSTVIRDTLEIRVDTCISMIFSLLENPAEKRCKRKKYYQNTNGLLTTTRKK